MNEKKTATGRTGGQGGADKPRVGLSGKLLMLTVVFVMVSEVLIYLPSVANFRLNWLSDRAAAAQIAAMVLQAAPDGMVPADLERQLLVNVGARAVAIRTGETRRLITASDMPIDVDDSYDLREAGSMASIADAIEVMLAPGQRTMRVIADAPMDGDFIELIMDEAPLQRAMFAFSRNILVLSLIISAVTASLVYLALHLMFVRPMRRITQAMVRFGHAPEDASRVVDPSSRRDEIGIAERELARMQTDLQAMLQQKSRLAALGLAVSKINHDLRNLLASASLAIDRIGAIGDPTVQRFAPKLIQTLDRAVRFCETTLKYGQAQEPPPVRRRFPLRPLVEEAGETLGLTDQAGLQWNDAVDPALEIDADPEQLFRVLVNLCRNAAQAIEAAAEEAGPPAQIRIAARREGTVVTIEVSDTGPGVPDTARANLFEAFLGSTKPGGTGLGLAIAAEIVQAHGGRIGLAEGTLGATFHIVIPDRVVELTSGRPRRRA